MENKGKYYITTAIAYASGKPHIGNTYEIIMADAIARYKRMLGYDVYFQTGTDEHGQKIEEKAKAANLTPKEFVDQQAGEIKRIWDLMNTSYDRFIRTTDEDHERQVKKIFKKLYDQGDIYKSEYEGWYCTPCESFWTDSQLVDGKCPDCGREVHKEKEESYFFKLSKYQKQLEQYINDHEEFIQPESRKNEMINNFLKPGLQDLCVSRTSFKWGIPVDFDPKHVVYVWIDALSNYITGLGYDVDGNHGELYKKYWPADLHLIGKDIIRFHTLYWPIMLLALNVPLPKQVFGHPWMLVGEDKISKSRGNAIYADDLVKFFGVDAIRYYVLHEMPFAQDGTITWELVIERINSDLANVYGNLVNRTVAMTNKYFNGQLSKDFVEEDLDKEFKSFILNSVKTVEDKMEQLRVGDSIEAIMEVFRRCNKYIDETAPWVLAKDEAQKGRLNTVLYNLLEGIRFGAVLMEPFMPETSARVYEQIGTRETSYDSLSSFGAYECNKVTEKPEPLFNRIDPVKTMDEVHAYLGQPEVEKVEHKAEIEFADFEKVEMVVGQVTECSKHPNADKILVFNVDFGYEQRQILSGVAAYYKPEELLGRKVIAVMNLKPRKIRGLESNGMLLSAVKQKDGKEVLELLSSDMEVGSIVC
ncbi:MAG: methionine--tRNA ligase [Erysipelotrichaceae bacterium]|nr:methionine--tRNA ligase [Erysipelotrichaceae bacterium]MBQ1775756.1 methionine--tRNA ligase [Erysipelotrichaceae bacterium]MBQ1811428.1 methionine--tRNA ligase [Erysipelotrichaceae bacterium]MBQ2078752.1 methionine--tRNA ligase [Erysipelotrichaceae bacterium]MBQ2505733.1 methionine--tRNA ligase [Erysipelotrichaceae bacterium]